MFNLRLAVLVTVLTHATLADRGYIITAPRIVNAGQPGMICVDLHDVSEAVTVEMKFDAIRYDYRWRPLEAGIENGTVAETTLVIPADNADESNCITLTVPEGLPKIDELKLKVKGYTAEGPNQWEFSDEKPLRVRDDKYFKSKFTFVQSDKPIYKPGQLVQFRIITLDRRMRADTSPIPLVYIETPGGSRVEQWTDVISQSGLTQRSFQLIDEPEEGAWKIVIKFDADREETQAFKVEKYVLPKYEVTLSPPKFLTFQSESADFEVCAKYTFGQDVRGNVEATVCLDENQYHYWDVIRLGGSEEEEENGLCTLINQPLVNGCAKIQASKLSVGWDRYTEFQWGVRAKFTAQVREQGTGVVLNATSQDVSFSQYDIKVDMEGPDKFKPGLPYNAKASVSRLDDVPAAGKIIEISISNWRAGSNYAKNYTSDSEGNVYFTIPPVVDERTSFTISAKAVEYSNAFWSWRSPQSSLYVNGWYSPTGSFLQVNPFKETLKCASDATFTVKYTTSEAADVKLMYKTTGIGAVSPSTSIPVTLQLDTLVTEPDADDDWDKSEYNRYWWGPIARVAESEDNDETTETEEEAEETIQSAVATHKGSFQITIPITSDLSKTSFLTIYYITPDGEVVADSFKLDVEECSPNHVEMDFSKDQALPGEKVDLNINAAPFSVCGYGVVDKSVFLLGGNNQLTLADLFKYDKLGQLLPNEYDGIYEDTNAYCKSIQPVTTAAPAEDSLAENKAEELTIVRSDYYSAYWETPYSDAYKGFQQGSLTVMSNLNLRTSPCIRRKQSNIAYFSANVADDAAPNNPPEASRSAGLDSADGSDGAKPIVEERRYYASSRGGGGGGLRAANVEAQSSSDRDNENHNSKSEKPIVEERTYFPETWLWDLVLTDDTGAAVVETEVPHTITQWMGSTMCLNSENGFGLSPPASIIAFQPVFVSMTLPYSVIRGEKVPIKVTASNYLTECLTVEIVMRESDEYSIVSSDDTHTACVCGQDTVTQEFMVILDTIGDVNISISTVAVADQGLCPSGSKMSKLIGISDAVTRPVIVEPEGAKREYTVSDFVCIDTPGGSGSVSEDYKLPLPDRFTLVPDSERAYVNVVGDVMGSALANIDSLLKMPYGCGEQNMLNFAPNIFVANYLNAINKNTPELEAKAKKHMVAGYQKELTYAHSDQSYSAFGKSDDGKSGSIWLTAFVVKCFGLAEPYIYIDPKIQQKSMTYFERNQQKDGCFPQLGMVHHKAMQGGIGSDVNNTQALSAYILIAMLEAGKDATSAEVVGAVECLTSRTPENAYTASLVTYALTLYNTEDSRTVSAYNALIDMAEQKDGKMHWKATDDEPEPKGHYWYYQPKSADVEATAYGLMSILAMTEDDEKVATALPVVGWLSRQRNAYGGFGSTQDTVIGLQALSKFASLIYVDDLDVQVSVFETGSTNSLADFTINDENSFIEYKAKLPAVTDLTVQAQGRGCFMVQTNVKYNIKNRAMDSSRQAFSTRARVFRQSGSKNPCTQRTLNICSRYLGEGGVSDMAIIAVKMQTGWNPDKSSLEALKKDSKVQLQKYEIDADGTVQLYFDALRRIRKCFNINMSQATKVDNAKPGIITTYDYYKKEERHETSFKAWLCRKPTFIRRPLPILF